MAGGNAIGSGAVVLSATLDPLTSGLAKARGDVRKWGKDTEKLGSASGTDFMARFGDKVRGGAGGGGAGGVLSKVGGALFKGAASTPIVGIAAAGIAAMAATGAAAKDSISEVGKTASIADALGLSVERFSGIAGVAKAAGEDTKEFIESLVTLGKVASEGAIGKGEVAPQFFKDLNLDAKEFAALKPDEMFFKFFEAVKKVEDPLSRTRAVMTAFGEDGGKFLLPLLSKAPGELRRMADGFKITAVEAEKAKKANEVFAAASAEWDKAWRNMAIAAAPFLGMISEVSGKIGKFTAAMSKFWNNNGVKLVTPPPPPPPPKPKEIPWIGGTYTPFTGMHQKDVLTNFAPAIQAGTEEAYKIQIRHDYGYETQQEKREEKQIKAIQDVGSKIDKQTKAIEKLAEKWDSF